jgi:hypothetical protein
LSKNLTGARSACCALLIVAGLAACGDDSDPIRPGGGAAIVEIDSDPRGASIFVDGQDRRKVTPDTLRGLSGNHEFIVRRDSAGASYGYRIQLRIAGDSVTRINGPLMLTRCSQQGCPLISEHTVSRIRFSRSPAGPLFHQAGTGGGAFWPGTTSNSYVSTGVPVFAMQIGQNPFALGIYDHEFLAGRPFPQVTSAAGAFSLRQNFWLIPPPVLLDFPTVRGLEVSEEVIGTPGIDDAIVVRVVFRNITNRPAYQAADPIVPPAGLRFDSAYIGFAVDPDIGNADDDLFAYDPELNSVFVYDAAFLETAFAGGASTAPALVGLRVLEAPAGARRILNGWPRVFSGFSADWSAGTESEFAGWLILSGRNTYQPDHADNTIGHLPATNLNDMRIAVSAGPLTLAPGDSAVLRVALAFADPAPGTFTSGTVVNSGSPDEPNRTIMQIAAPLRAKLRAAEGIR